MNTPQLQETLLSLYRGCRDSPVADFKRFAMDTVRRVVEFDSGIWVTSTIVSNDFNSVYLYHQTPEMMANYYRTVSLDNAFLAQAAISNKGTTVRSVDVIPYDEFLTHPTYLNHCRHYGMEHSLCTCCVSPVTNIFSGMSFYRADPDKPFSEADRQSKEWLVPHMIEAMRINLFSNLSCTFPRSGNAQAICDPFGMLYEATPGFPEVVRAAWPEWQGPKLPLPFESLAGSKPVQWAMNGLRFEALTCQDLFLLTVREEELRDRLSGRQIEVANRLAEGKSYKTIARELDISPNTVVKHVNQINTRLGIQRREQLVSVIRGSVT